jgi:anti-sigma regulatory factor (Ser/Thr protein kinase)
MTRPPAPPPPPQDLGPIEYRFSPSLPAIRLARHVLANWLELQPGVHVDGIDDLLVACSELVTNAVRHATGRHDQVVLRVMATGDAVVLEIEDDGDGFAWPVSRVMADVLADDESGRGLFIVEALTDQVEVLVSQGRTVVRCLKRGMLHQPAADDTDLDATESADLSARFRAESHPADSNR